MQKNEIEMNAHLARDIMPQLKHQLKQANAKLKYQQEELENHRRLDFSCILKTPEQKKMEGKDDDDKSDFTF